jgi:hypothetical protein
MPPNGQTLFILTAGAHFSLGGTPQLPMQIGEHRKPQRRFRKYKTEDGGKNPEVRIQESEL